VTRRVSAGENGLQTSSNMIAPSTSMCSSHCSGDGAPRNSFCSTAFRHSIGSSRRSRPSSSRDQTRTARRCASPVDRCEACRTPIGPSHCRLRSRHRSGRSARQASLWPPRLGENGRWRRTRLALRQPMSLKPSCLISCSQPAPDGGTLTPIGWAGTMKPVGKARCNMPMS
jgi:hypothetical protein